MSSASAQAIRRSVAIGSCRCDQMLCDFQSWAACGVTERSRIEQTWFQMLISHAAGDAGRQNAYFLRCRFSSSWWWKIGEGEHVVDHESQFLPYFLMAPSGLRASLRPHPWTDLTSPSHNTINTSLSFSRVKSRVCGSHNHTLEPSKCKTLAFSIATEGSSRRSPTPREGRQYDQPPWSHRRRHSSISWTTRS